jgi:hypothetical protein
VRLFHYADDDVENNVEMPVLPVDLDKELEGWWGDPDADDYFAEMKVAGTPVPPFDLSYPEHFAKLKEWLEWLTED